MRTFIVKSFHLCIYASKSSRIFNKILIPKMTFASLANASVNVSPPMPSDAEKQYNEKVRKIVDDISKLTLIEVSELNECLKKTLKIPDAPMMSFGSMPIAGQTSAVEEEDEDTGSKTVQTSFTLKLNKYDETKKVALIKEIKTVVEGMNLVQAKKFVESSPQILKTNISKDEAEKLKGLIEAAGGICTIE